jgi:hypothetical protein
MVDTGRIVLALAFIGTSLAMAFLVFVPYVRPKGGE